MNYTINERHIKSTDFGGLLAVILGNPETAYHVSNFISNSNNIPTLDQLQKIHGVGRSNALKVLACMELSSKYIVGTKSQTYRCPEDIAAKISFLKFEVQEHLCLITMDSANHIINVHELTTGLVNQTPVHPREAFRQAIADNATSVIFAHNHPSGSTEESKEDLSITCPRSSRKNHTDSRHRPHNYQQERFQLAAEEIPGNVRNKVELPP